MLKRDVVDDVYGWFEAWMQLFIYCRQTPTSHTKRSVADCIFHWFNLIYLDPWTLQVHLKNSALLIVFIHFWCIYHFWGYLRMVYAQNRPWHPILRQLMLGPKGQLMMIRSWCLPAMREPLANGDLQRVCHEEKGHGATAQPRLDMARLGLKLGAGFDVIVCWNLSHMLYGICSNIYIYIL